MDRLSLEMLLYHDKIWIRIHNFFVYRAINIYSKAKQTLVTDPKNKNC